MQNTSGDKRAINEKSERLALARDGCLGTQVNVADKILSVLTSMIKLEDKTGCQAAATKAQLKLRKSAALVKRLKSD